MSFKMPVVHRQQFGAQTQDGLIYRMPGDPISYYQPLSEALEFLTPSSIQQGRVHLVTQTDDVIIICATTSLVMIVGWLEFCRVEGHDEVFAQLTDEIARLELLPADNYNASSHCFQPVQPAPVAG